MSIEDISSTIDVTYPIKPFVIFKDDLWANDEQSNRLRNLLTDFFFTNNNV